MPNLNRPSRLQKLNKAQALIGESPVRCLAKIQLSHVWHNLNVLSRFAPQARIISMVKADAYGHGAVPVARLVIQHSRHEALGVATATEGFELRRAGIAGRIFVFSDSIPWNLERAQFFLVHGLEPVFSEFASLQVALDQGFSGRFHVEINTGMNRLGLTDDEWNALVFPKKIAPDSVFAHYLESEVPSSPFTRSQSRVHRQWIERIKSRFPGTKIHFANTGAILESGRYPEVTGSDWIRPGIGLYGYAPSFALQKKHEKNKNHLKPVMSVYAPVLQVKRVGPGQPVGYNATFITSVSTALATLGIGYGDGLFRAGSKSGLVFLGGQRCRVAGRISMDLTTVLAPKSVVPGDLAEILGSHQSGHDVAKRMGTSIYEFLTRIGPRVIRDYV